jgi:hypothetical protein
MLEALESTKKRPTYASVVAGALKVKKTPAIKKVSVKETWPALPQPISPIASTSKGVSLHDTPKPVTVLVVEQEEIKCK